jgi:LacI family transcriptional regulator, galactose operon repressor
MEGSDQGWERETRRRATVRDVALLAGTSVKTVSRVINDESGVRPELVERVQRAVAQLGYRPDERARRLRQGTSATHTIGLIQSDVGNPFFASIHMGIEEVASRSGHVVLAASSEGSVRRFNEVTEAFISRRVDGLIVVPVGDDMDLFETETEMGTPVVFVDQVPSGPPGDVVHSDHFGGAREAVSHLLEAGHERIAFLGDDPSFHSAVERKRGWAHAHLLAGREPDRSLERDNVGSSEASGEAVEELLALKDPPTALFTAQNLISVGALRTLRRLGRERDVAVVGFDDIELADLVEPGLTAIRQDPAELGRRAGELLLQRLRGDRSPWQRIVLPVQLVTRGSGEITRPGIRDDPSR